MSAVTQPTLWHPELPTRRPEIVLRPYQAAALESVFEKWAGGSTSVLVVLPTGVGKTILFAKVIARMGSGRTMVLAHREKLIRQAADKIERVTGIEPDIEMGSQWANESRHARSSVVVGSAQTQVSGDGQNGRMARFNPHDFGLLIIDEAHHATSPTYGRIIRHYRQNPNLKVLGVTATPDRADEVSLGKVFDDFTEPYEINEAIEDGWLVPIKESPIRLDDLDLSHVKANARDLNESEVDEIMQEGGVVHGVAYATYELSGGRKTLLFATSVAHASKLVEILNRYESDCARLVHGKTPSDDRRELFRDYSDGRFRFLVNVGVTTEGFDEPTIGVVSVARPTKSRALYSQMVGRGTRPLDGVVDPYPDAADRRSAIARSDKPFMQVIDFMGNAGKHKLMSVADILGGRYDDDVVESAKRTIERKADGVPADVAAELEAAKAEKHRRFEEERERRRKLVVSVRYSVGTSDPFDLLDIEPERERGWHRGRLPTVKQAEFLEKTGIKTNNMSFTQASQLIGEIIKRRKSDMASMGQVRCLARFGVDGSQLKFKAASNLIDEIKRNGWRLPDGVLE